MPRIRRVVGWAAAMLFVGAALGAQAPADTAPRPAPRATVTDTTSRALPAPGDTIQPAPAPAKPAVSAAQRVRLAQEEARGSTWGQRAVSFVGLLVFLVIAWSLSTDRRAIPWATVAWGMGLQLVFALLVLRTSPGREFFDFLNVIVTKLLGYTTDGARFIFGNLVEQNVPVGPADGPMAPLGSVRFWANTGAYFAFNVLPTIIFFSSLMTLLYYLGVMQWVVKGFAWVMLRTMKTSGAETLSSAANVFLGQTEAPLLVKPFVRLMTNSELFAVMVGGFANVAGGVLAAYVGMLQHTFPSIAGHLIAASVMSAPASLAIAKLMFPEKEEPVTKGSLRIELEKIDANVIDAAARGASEGLTLALNVAAMLLAFIALLGLLNGLLGWLGGFVGLPNLSLQLILGYVGAPLAWLMGAPWKDALAVGMLIGEKTAINEFVAYLHLAQLLESGADLSARAVIVATYALCGFANFASIAIQIGGIGGMAPERRSDLSRLGLKAMIGGSLTSFTVAAVAGMVI